MKVTRVLCEGKHHIIGLTPKGALVFFDHPDGFAKDIALSFFGGNLEGCYFFQQVWGDFITSVNNCDVNDAFDGEYSRNCEISYSRIGRVDIIGDLLETPVILRCKLKTQKALTQIFNKCEYKIPKRTTIECFAHYIPVTSNVERNLVASSHLYRVSAKKIKILVPISWYIKVYKRGLGVVNGYLILNIVEENENEIIVWAIKQVKNNKLVERKAVIKKEQNDLCLSWLKEKRSIDDYSNVVNHVSDFCDDMGYF